MMEYNAPPPPPRRDSPAMHKVSMFVRASQRDALREYAQRHDSSFAAVVRQAFDEYLQRRGIDTARDDTADDDGPAPSSDEPRAEPSNEGLRPGTPWTISGPPPNPSEQS